MKQVIEWHLADKENPPHSDYYWIALSNPKVVVEGYWHSTSKKWLYEVDDFKLVEKPVAWAFIEYPDLEVENG